MKIKHPATGKQLEVVTLDFETYFAQDYTLRSNAVCKMNTSEYVRSEMFKAQCCGFKLGTDKAFCVPGDMIKDVLASINWSNAALLCHNTAFDGLILSHHYGVVPALYLDSLSMARALHSNEIRAGLDDVAKFYGVGNKMQDVLGKTKAIRDLPDELLYPLMAYCQEDVRLTYDIFKLMVKDFPVDELELIDITIGAFCDPVLKIDVPRCQKELAREVAHKKAVLKKATGTDDYELAKECLGKNDWLAQALLDVGVTPPMKYSIKQEKMIYAFAKGDEEFVALMDDEDSDAAALVEARLAVKSSIGETRAGRLLAMQEKKEWCAPVGYNYYGAHCVPGDTEVLTRSGWQRLDEWTGGEIAQVHPNQTIEFLEADRFVGEREATWLKCDAPYVKCDFTLGHTMPYLTQKSHQWNTVQAGAFDEQRERKVPIGGTLKQAGGISPEQMRVLAMVQADGSYEQDTAVGAGLRIFLKKERKKERCRDLLDAAGIAYTEHEYPSWPGFTRFVIRPKDYPAWLTPDRKCFGPWLLEASTEALNALMQELEHWDGHRHKNNQVQYSTSEAANAEWIVTVAHLTGRSASTYIKPAKGNRRDNFVVSLRERDFALVRKSHLSYTAS